MNEVLTPKTLAVMTDYNIQTIWRYIRTGHLRATKAGGYKAAGYTITVVDAMDFIRRLPALSKSGRKKRGGVHPKDEHLSSAKLNTAANS